MIRLLDQLKQGLRRIGRGRFEAPGGLPTVSQVNDWGQATRLRTEVDDAPSSLEKRLTPTTPPAGPQSGRTRKAVLSRASRTAASQNALTLWGMVPVALTDRSADPTPPDPGSMLSGSSLLQRLPAVVSEQRDPPSGLLGGAIPLTATQEVAHASSLLEHAPTLSPDDDRIDRLF